MGNNPGRRLRRNPRFYATPRSGNLDAYRCGIGGGYTVTVVTADGDVPRVINCRAACCEDHDRTAGIATSIGAPRDWPAGVPVTPRWEWYAPDAAAIHQMRTVGGPIWEHVRTGGLLLRRRRSIR